MVGLSSALKSALLVCLILVSSWAACGAIVHHKFIIGTQEVTKLCNTQTVVTVNGQLPGPTITVHEGDNLIVEVENNAPYNITIHWHGVTQFKSCWADGTPYVSQCPIIPGNKFTYNFTVRGQEGTLWWHAHITYLRSTVHGALIILPRPGIDYPFPKPDAEILVILGEWWNANVEDVLAIAIQTGAVPADSNASTINGQPGDFFPCSANDTTRFLVERGKTYLMRIVNCVMLQSYFFKIAEHLMTVVAVDAEYTKPYATDVLLTHPGNTMDILITTTQQSGLFYIATRVYNSIPLGTDYVNTTTTAILQYKDSSNTSAPVLPTLPAFNDTATAIKFSSNLRSLNPSVPQIFDVDMLITEKISRNLRSQMPSVPQIVDVEMLITEGLALISCPNNSCAGAYGGRSVGAFNNISFAEPNISILQAYYFGIEGVFTTDFPDNPPVVYDYTGTVPLSLWGPELGTKVKVLKFNSNVQIVFQNTGIITIEDHPIHLHGHNFYFVGQGFGNYDSHTDPAKFNLVDPPLVNTNGVPPGGWAAIRFIANNPGAWLMHCHFESHSAMGFDMVFITEDGPRSSDKLPPPPFDLPKC